jgi:hypothetical protein
MSVLYITAYNRLAYDSNASPLPAPHEPALGAGSIDISSISENVSDPMPPNTHFVCLVAEDDCFVEFGPTPSARVGANLILAGERIYFGASPGHRIAVIGRPVE